jgi:putative PEP-CTERM system histidine kinase
MSSAIFGVIAYGTASAGFLLLTLLLLTSWEGRGQGGRLVVASGVTTLWAALLAYDAWSGGVQIAALALAEFLRDGAWLLVLTGLTSLPGPWARLSQASLLAALTATALAAAQLIAGPFRPLGYSIISLLVYGGLGLSLLAMVLLEQLYRNANPAGRHALKYFVIGAGSLFAYDLFLYSQAQLLGGIEAASWAARGLVSALAVPMIALAARRNPQWSLNVFVSRQGVFYSTSFLAIGAYLLVMAAGGYVIALYGGTWGRIVQLLFFAGAGMVLLVLMSSANLRRRLRVFLSKHFYRNKYDYRVEWLRFIATLSRRDVDADVRANAVRSIAQIIGSAGGALYLPSDAEGAFIAVATWPAPDFPRARYPKVGTDEDLPRFLRDRQWVVDLKEYARSPDLYQNMALPAFVEADPRVRLVVPLVLGQQLLGFVVLADPPPPFETTYEDRDLLKTVGRDVAMHLAQHEADRQLAESRQFEAYHRLTAFVMHDLKNLAAQLSMIVSNADRHRRNPEFVDDAISTIAHSSARMQRLIEQLQGREVQAAVRRTNIGDVAREACTRCAVRQPVPTLAVLEPVAVQADAERLGMMIEHLIRNAQDATPPTGQVRVEVSLEHDAEIDPGGSTGAFPVLQPGNGAAGLPGSANGASPPPSPGPQDVAVLTVSDTGSGMTPQFVKERLFRPFDTTKGSKGMGIGAYQVREYVHALGGRVSVQSVPGEGTRVTLRLPACP